VTNTDLAVLDEILDQHRNSFDPTMEPEQFLSFSRHRSGDLGRAYLTLGRALQAQGKRDESRAALRSGAEHLQNALGPDHPDALAARQLAELDTKDR
jgi:Tetratricopeptide repeat